MHKAHAQQRRDLASVAGALAREVAVRAPREAPGVFGAFLVCWGIYQIFPPVAWIVAGLFLLLIDWRASS